MKRLADIRNKMFKLIGSLGFDGWFYITGIALMTVIIGRFLPMITAVIFCSCFMWFIDFVKFFTFVENRTNKPIYCGIAGTLLGIAICYLIFNNIIWV